MLHNRIYDIFFSVLKCKKKYLWVESEIGGKYFPLNIFIKDNSIGKISIRVKRNKGCDQRG